MNRPDMFDLRVEREQALRKAMRSKIDAGVMTVTPAEVEEYRSEVLRADRMMGADQ